MTFTDNSKISIYLVDKYPPGITQNNNNVQCMLDWAPCLFKNTPALCQGEKSLSSDKVPSRYTLKYSTG